MKKLLLTIALALMSSTGVANAASAPVFNLQDLLNAGIEKIQLADTDAKANNDVFADECYVGAITFLKANPTILPNPGPISDPITAFQAARDVVKGGQKIALVVSKGIPPELVQACGPLALDVNNDLARATAGGFLGLFGG